jgi:hypothetical protein
MRKRIKLLIAALMLALTMSVGGVAFGAEKHPPKFSVKSKQCSSGANQPHCPGNH